MRTYLSDLAAVPYQKTAGTGEFVGLTWQYPDGQFFMGKVCARKLECFRRLGLVFVYLSEFLSLRRVFSSSMLSSFSSSSVLRGAS